MKQEVQVLITLEWDPDIQMIDSADGVLKAIVNTYDAAVYKSDKTGEYYPKIIASSIKKEESDIIKLNRRDAIEWFANQMESKLVQNEHKAGWKDMNLITLYGKLSDSYQKLLRLVLNHNRTPNIKGIHSDTINECTDVANYAMMIADLHGHKFGK